MWSELRKKELNSMDQNSRDRLAFEFFFEERVWYLSSVLKNFKLEKLQPKVMLKMQARL